MIQAFLDTNVLASAIRGHEIDRSTPGEVWRRWYGGQFQLVVSDHVLTELARTLENSYFAKHVPAVARERSIQAVRRCAEIVRETASVSGVATHAEDDRVLSAAVSAGVDYLVTGDGGLLAVEGDFGFSIVKSAEFIAILDRASAE